MIHKIVSNKITELKDTEFRRVLTGSSRFRFENGNLIDIAWNFGYLSIGIAALYQKELIESFK